MPQTSIQSIQTVFSSRLNTLTHLLDSAKQHLGDDAATIMQQRLHEDMLPFATQIVFTCNQAHKFALWCADKPDGNLDTDLTSIEQALSLIAETQAELKAIDAKDEKLNEPKRLEFPNKLYAELTGAGFVNDFLIPNFYFHLVTAYDILRMQGVPVGKRDFMMHLMPFVRQG